jgi:AcrR family transcriptional regulator
MSVKRPLRAEHAEATRTALLKAGRKLFAKHGIAAVSAEEIAREARVTRGALYHHFKDKKDLFSALCDEVGEEMRQRVEDAAMPIAATDPWRAMQVGIGAFLDACVEGDFQRIVILEAPSLEGWAEWRKHAEIHEMGIIKMGLEMVMEAGLIARQPVDTLAWMLFSILNEGAMLIAHAEDREAARAEVGDTINVLMDGLRIK